MATGFFVAFEGCEGSGKSTQAQLLLDHILEHRSRAVLVHEPGTTPLGLYLRNYLKSKQPLSKEAELLLFEASRAQLVVDKIQPSLTNNFVVIADRFSASSVAYQGYGRKIDIDLIQRLNDFATAGLTPDLTILLDIDPAEGLRRVAQQFKMALGPNVEAEPGRLDVEAHRKFEDQPIHFHSRVRKGYLTIAKSDPERWLIVDASGSEDEVSNKVRKEVTTRLKV